ncbi:MAG: VWA domain-containing protein [Pseudanabaena sp. M57BS1SP1A06MG]|nr:VWA domain-containing protein [Pseudanabaena sp. M53BS1SP1A06MG]MCA6583423.1 VWA domain-containing protein [Pseudanabaena sp. M34BS1SP1A06MG]MCA6591386.1 VWA domain-containing protein [Pseudanabaena sp. M38BS1SP1A06MG]MCA6602767.1 VWA domain-containing protein [Pseudanabaena sp. M57BS1SP1A06MG]
MQEPLVYLIPKWTELCVSDFKEKSTRLSEVIEEGESKIYNFETFVSETYHRLYDRHPKRLDDNAIKPENKIWIVIHQQMSELEVFQQFSDRMNGDEFLAGIGTTALCIAIAEMLPEPAQPLEDPEIIRNQLRGIFEALQGQTPSAGLMQKIQQLKQQGLETRLACEAYADSISPSEIETALLIGIAKAEAEMQSIAESLEAFSGGNNYSNETQLKIADKIQLAQRIQSSPKLQAIAELAGKKIAIAAKMQRTKVKEGRTEIVGVTTGNDLTRLLPCELVKLTEPALFPIFAQGYIERSLLQRELISREPLARGPIIICLDSSGSMQGQPEIWSKAIALALLSIAVSQKRHCRILHFTDVVERIDDFAGEIPDTNRVIDCIEKFYNGGSTSFTDALTGAFASIRQHEQTKKADVILITDGLDTPSTQFIEQWQTDRKKYEFSCYGILISSGNLSSYASTISKLCDRYVQIEDLTDDSEVSDCLYSI